MNAGSPAVKLTYDDFVRFPDDGKRHELIDGEHYVTPSPNTKHQRIGGSLYLLIGMWLESHPIGQVFFAPFDVLLSRFDVVEPDLLYFSNGTAARVLTEDNVKGAPDLVVEVTSKSTRKRDETIKRQLYERTGVAEYWLVDSKSDVIRIYRRTGDAFGAPVELSREQGHVLTTPSLPGLKMPLARIFRV